MDFKFNPSEEEFRAEVRRFLEQRLPSDWADRDFVGDVDAEERRERARRLTQELADRRWLAMAWPKAYGGLDAGHMEQMLFNEASSYYSMPGGGGMGVAWVGPAIMMYGSEEQKERYLPRITSGEDTWCTLYSEPGAGSDLASLQTRAERDGDHYVINGQKIWTSGAHEANVGWLAARTDPRAPKHRGISTLVVPMDAPGITVRPLPNLAGEHQFNEVYFEDVRVPADHLVGTENRGWYQVASALDFERSGVGAYARGQRSIERLVAVVRGEPGLVERNPRARYELADRWIELEVGYNIAYRIPYLQAQGLAPNHEASVSKLYGSELTQRIAGTGVHLLGMEGMMLPGSPYARLGGAFSRAYMNAVSATIAAGTSEIQRNIIAQRGLGLPR